MRLHINNTVVNREKNERVKTSKDTSMFANTSMTVESSTISKRSSSGGDIADTTLGSKRKSCDHHGYTGQDDEAPAEEKASKLRRVISKNCRSADLERRLLSKLSTTVDSMTAENRELARTQKEMTLAVHNLRKELKKALALVLTLK